METPYPNPSVWFRGYEQTYLERDLRELSQVADLISFRSLMQLAAFRTAKVLNVSQLARDAKLNTATASRYLNLTEAGFLLFRLPPYVKNRASRLVKSPKLYFSDSGLACHMAGVENLDQSELLRGPLTETYMAQNLHAILTAHEPASRLYYWNVQGRYEVDFVIEKGKVVLAIEFKMGTRWKDQDLASLRAFLAATPGCKAAVLAYNGKHSIRLDEKLWAIPAGTIIS